MGRASPNDGSEMDYHSNFLDVRNGGCSNSGHGAGHGCETLKGDDNNAK